MIKTLYQIGSFGLVGLSATALHTLVFSILSWSGVTPLIGNFIAFCCAVPVSFYGNRYLTFKTDGNIFKFALMSFAGFALNHANVWFVTHFLRMSWEYALPGMLIAVPAFSFIISKLWVYEQ
ncbi:MAG: GtrA family protein [Rhizobium sp.]|uniref:GtrA family protein n=1 Tax=Rhizobium sp. SYY.PMSO TaxID=3382192 RepID=UPI000DD9C526